MRNIRGWLVGVVFLIGVPSLAAAQITQPNGMVYPRSSNSEIQLSALFAGRGEAVDWVNDASQEPNVFSPLCDFTATLVLKQSGSSLNVGWYNATGTQPSAAEIYPIFPAALQSSSVGITVTGQTIRESPNYAGGLIGFALIRGDNPAYYFTERQYNPECTGGPCTGGGNAYVGRWIMSLSYRSTVTPNAFYVAFEDGGPTAPAGPTTAITTTTCSFSRGSPARAPARTVMLRGRWACALRGSRSAMGPTSSASP